MAKLFPTTLVGSYPQPDWLIDRKKLAGRFPPRVRATELWRVTPDRLDETPDDAPRLANRDQERPRQERRGRTCGPMKMQGTGHLETTRLMWHNLRRSYAARRSRRCP